MSIYDKLVTNMRLGVEDKFEEPTGNLGSTELSGPKKAADGLRGRRPLKMPKNYNFSVRNINWDEYRNDFLLRTDAVWEKSKLMDMFYTHYKSKFMFDAVNNRYLVADIRMMPVPTNEPEHFEEWCPFLGFTDIDGCIWQFKVGPMVQNPTSLSRFVSDREGDSWYLCYMAFQKFMLCNERSPLKVDECHLYNKGFWEYPCYDEVEQLLDHCGPDLFEPMFELYRVRLLSGTLKPQSYNRL